MTGLFKNHDRIVGIILLILSLLLYWRTFDFQTRPFVPLNTAFWPRLILAALGCVGLFLVIKGRLTEEAPLPFARAALLILIAAAGFVLVCDWLGFWAASLMATYGGFLWLVEKRDKRSLLIGGLYSLLASSLVYALFNLGLGVQLPTGIFG